MAEKPDNLRQVRKSTVLIAQQDNTLRQTLALISKSFGWKVVEASRGVHAWKLLEKNRVDYVLADWDLPEIAGLGMLSLVRAHFDLCTLPVILMAKRLSKQEVVEAGRAGVSNLWLMPASTQELTSRVRQAFFRERDAQEVKAKELLHEGSSLLFQGKLEEAAQKFEEVLTTFEQAEIYYNLGYIKAAQEKYPEAIVYFRKAAEINSAFVAAYRKLAECYEKMGKPHLAQRCFQAAAAIYLERDMDEEAENMLNEVLKLAPETINVYNSLGILYRKRQEFDKAVALYLKALKVTPRDENVYYNLARTYYECGDYPAAEAAVQKALAINQDFGHAHDLEHMIKKKMARPA